MFTATKTITINAAFLQEIKEDSQDFRCLLARAHGLLSGSHIHIARKRLVDLLGELRDQLALHFALEEAYGYFEDAVAAEPRLGRLAEGLRAEHATMFVKLCALEETAERWLYHESTANVLRQIATDFDTFHKQFLDHESRENDLILEALAEEIGDWD
jgi:hypothetical protein